MIKKKPKIFESLIKVDKRGIRYHANGCNCKKSMCLKNYCECRIFGLACTSLCKCLLCKNEKNKDIGLAEHNNHVCK